MPTRSPSQKQQHQNVVRYIDPSSAREVELVAGDPEVSSAGLGWDGIELEQGVSHDFEVLDLTSPHFYLAMQLRRPARWERRDEHGKWRTVTSEPGHIWVNPPGRPFSHRFPGRNEYLVVTVSRDRVRRSLRSRGMPEIISTRLEYNAQDLRLQTVMQGLLAAAVTNPPGDDATFANLLGEALCEHLLHAYREDHPPRALSSPPRGIRPFPKTTRERVENFLRAQIAEPLDLDTLAKVAHMSKYHCARVFHATFGCTPGEWVRRRRIELAKSRLKDGESPGEVAFTLGFSDQSHFGREFKKQTGSTPRQWQKFAMAA